MLRAITIAALLVALPAGHAIARGQLQARPTLVEVSPGDRAGRLVLANTGDAPVTAQVRVFAWSQVDGEDRLSDTNQVAFSPAIVKIPAGGEQLVRVVLVDPSRESTDQSFRLVVDELPSPATEQDAAIELRLRYLIPLFVRAAGADAPALQCWLAVGELSCGNSGGRPARLGATRMVDADGSAVSLAEGLFGYVLPGSTRNWVLDAPALTKLDAGLRLETQVNGQPAVVPVTRQP